MGALTGGSASAYSASVVGITLPAAPTQLIATAIGRRVTLAWTDNSISETGFVIQRSSDNGATWAILTTTGANSTATGTYADTTVGEGAAYSYRVQAVNTAGHSATSNAPSVTIIPAAPSGLTATASSGTQINLVWTDNSTGETGTLIERSANGGSTWSQVTTTAANAVTYHDTGLTPGTSYSYRISAINAGGASTYATAAGLTAPAAPGNVVAAAVSVSEVDVHWSPVSSATSYLVERSLDGTTWTQFGTVTTTSYTDLSLAEGTPYQYRVTAINGGGSSIASSISSATTLPAAPTSALAAGISPTRIDVTWSNASQGANGFVLQRTNNGGDTWTTLASPTASQVSYSDTNVLEATTYAYRVKAVNAGGTSNYDNTAPVTTIPVAPTSLTATPVNSTTVQIAWTNNSLRATNVVLQRSIDGENFTTLNTASASSQAYTDTTALPATLYWYRTFATSAGGTSDYSNAAQVTTQPASPQNAAANPVSATVVNLTWDAVAGATGYNILRSTDSVNFSPLHASSVASYSDTTAIEGTEYWYQVTASNDSGASAPSTRVHTRTVPSAPLHSPSPLKPRARYP